MPYKFNESRRHKIPKAKYRVSNWPDYDAALVRRGSLTVWVTEEAVAAWHAPATGARGGQPIYSDIAIETGLALCLVLHQPLRQTEGALRSIASLPGVEIRIPDHTTLSRRGGGLTILSNRIARAEPLHLLVDSTGVKVYGEGEWLDQKHGVRSRRRWRKLHLAVDADTHEIAAAELTPDDVGDLTVLPDLLAQIEDPVTSVIADGAYDAQTAYDAVTARHPEAAVVIPPARRQSRARPHRHCVTSISRQSPERGASHGRVQDIVGAAGSRQRCTDTRPSSGDAFTPGVCPIRRPRRK